MKIAVLTDSSAYLTKEQQEKYHIDVLPIPIMWGDKTYRDMIDIGYEEFYKNWLMKVNYLQLHSHQSVIYKRRLMNMSKRATPM